MTADSIGAQLETLIGGLVPLYLSEAEVEEYPYGVYSQTVTPYFTKDGLYKYVADASIKLYSQDFDALDALADNVVSTLDTSMRTGGFYANFVAKAKDCVEGVWVIQLDYRITQIL